MTYMLIAQQSFPTHIHDNSRGRVFFTLLLILTCVILFSFSFLPAEQSTSLAAVLRHWGRRLSSNGGVSATTRVEATEEKRESRGCWRYSNVGTSAGCVSVVSCQWPHSLDFHNKCHKRRCLNRAVSIMGRLRNHEEYISQRDNAVNTQWLRSLDLHDNVTDNAA